MKWVCKKKNHFRLIKKIDYTVYFFIVLPEGIEPPTAVPKTAVISV
ncbi:MAG: hypothetical protein UV82_C0002G0051 [Candidatus Magasanikbacteria bacterium GW2011_GWD2_43_18]|uniref:Uncharacterized protein n=1 Tax=Candidatus Magasanikbacteria bacterium GW2011_GWE2_42_7 TaxID=1619052 RepID=A0A0G1BEU7_9BACT|nr:MAG: hypothetical protein UV18_C0003G0051 [Candidatus Magasanikbacteria bacterium GW2011_GWC2_42_27]KKS71905.1 MAG: hypothetical protein UV42_C0017G0009 [Candidatus Magasanikbacteria bacterium GW2011_GWE2_42_7]KKT05081.1 MAG: hypothetical protein UV82_C0002G0051 [Candidatus Magasanikbacteria bacterium GW2011_GWD2_43_18]KKT25243.1 MAG: hypothetical protein UW10_C0011G0016 [Candidatus Magasanikbacteria bacterium GW2011_GWA2_43_9]